MNEKKLSFNNIKKAFMSNASSLNIVVLIALIIFFYAYNSAFLGAYNIKTMLTSVATLLIMACGATYVRLLGSLDLSMGAVSSVGAVILVVYIHDLGWAIYPAILIFGALTGLILGLIHTKFKLPSFIASLGMMSIYQSLALSLCPASTRVMSEDKIFISWGKISLFDTFSMLFFVAIVIMIIMHFIQRHTMIGKCLNMIGANERAARLAGINVDKTKIFAFIVCGMTSALTGIILAIKMSSADSMVGDSYTFLAVASVLLGGTAMTGGRGSIFMTLIGVLMVIVIQNGMSIVGVGAWWNSIVFGIVIMVAMILTTDRRTKNMVVK